MNKLGFFFLSVLLLGLAETVFAQAAEQPMTSPEAIKSFLVNPSITHSQKWAYARAVSPVTPPERIVLQGLIQDVGEGDGWYYALARLVSANDYESGAVMGPVLCEKTNRYYALALGLLGYKDGAKYLRQTLLNSPPSFVAHACQFALRLLGEKDKPLMADEPKTLDTSFPVALSASKTNLFLGDSFYLQSEIENKSSHVIRLVEGRQFFNQYLKVKSIDGEFVLPITLAVFDYDPDVSMFPLIEMGSALSITNACVVQVLEPKRTEWVDMIPSRKTVCLMSEDQSWCYDIGFYEPQKTFDVELTIVYEPVVPANALKRLGMAENTVLQERIVSNPLRLHILEPGVRKD